MDVLGHRGAGLERQEAERHVLGSAGAGLEMLAISLDRDFDDVADTAARLSTGFPTLHDAGGAIGELYQVNRMPYVVLIDQDGIVRDEFTGFSKGEGSEYVDKARTLLAE